MLDVVRKGIAYTQVPLCSCHCGVKLKNVSVHESFSVFPVVVTTEATTTKTTTTEAKTTTATTTEPQLQKPQPQNRNYKDHNHSSHNYSSRNHSSQNYSKYHKNFTDMFALGLFEYSHLAQYC